jgi:ribosomal protein L37AE/L43A
MAARAERCRACHKGLRRRAEAAAWMSRCSSKAVHVGAMQQRGSVGKLVQAVAAGTKHRNGAPG